MEATQTGDLNYDHRERGTDIETNRSASIELLRDLEIQIRNIGEIAVANPLNISTMIDSAQDPIMCPTSIGRELSFVISHTIHHNAVIGTMARTVGATLPEKFGYAPSTIAFQKQIQCAQ